LARDLAIAENDLADDQFSQTCPFILSQVLREDFWPDFPPIE